MRPAKKFLYDGKNLTIQQWSEVTGVPCSTLYQRLNNGWSYKDAFRLGLNVWRDNFSNQDQLRHRSEKIDPATGFVAPRIVCAANKLKNGKLVLGARHGDALMRSVVPGAAFFTLTAEQGFVDQFGKFYSRKDAWNIAVKEHQIIRFCGNQSDFSKNQELYSENLY